ncbi:MAG: hypothetical protein EBZ77_03915 [Chitinophagia bacterium]|nr:hypothetical protein [Chitinophagia bacterium]
MKQFIGLAMLLASLSTTAMAQTQYDTLRDEKNNSLIYRGSITFGDIMQEPSFGWMKEGTATYTPAEKTIQHLKPQLARCRFLVFMGTWCEDSQHLIPQFLKTLQACGYNPADVLLYGMDRAKTSGTGIEKTYGATLLPTIIIYYDNKEVGRIIETVPGTIEAELDRIISAAQH